MAISMALISYSYNTDKMSVKRHFKGLFNLLIGDSEDSKSGKDETERIEKIRSQRKSLAKIVSC